MYSGETRGQIVKLISLMGIKSISLYDLGQVISRGKVKAVSKLSLLDLAEIAESCGVKIVAARGEMFTLGSEIRFSIYSEGRRIRGRTLKGKIIFVNEFYISVKLKNYIESFELFGFRCGNYVILK